jgi:hypothetical protein
MRSLSPLAINVGWVIAERFEGADRPNLSVAISCV